MERVSAAQRPGALREPARPESMWCEIHLCNTHNTNECREKGKPRGSGKPRFEKKKGTNSISISAHEGTLLTLEIRVRGKSWSDLVDGDSDSAINILSLKN